MPRSSARMGSSPLAPPASADPPFSAAKRAIAVVVANRGWPTAARSSRSDPRSGRHRIASFDRSRRRDRLRPNDPARGAEVEIDGFREPG
jgi:hypothetical protein